MATDYDDIVVGDGPDNLILSDEEYASFEVPDGPDNIEVREPDTHEGQTKPTEEPELVDLLAELDKDAEDIDESPDSETSEAETDTETK